MRPQSATAKTLEVQTNRDFLGYEKDFYKVLSRSDGGIEVRFSHAEFWENGKSHRKTQPGLLLFPREENGRYIRLVYLVRASAADHDMAIISAAAHDGLHALTEAVIVRAQCKSDESATCTWVPKGVAVDPER